MFCHPERSEGSIAIGREMLRCAQHDRTGFDWEKSSSAVGCDKSAPTVWLRYFVNLHQ